LSIVSDHVCPLMAIMYPSSVDYFQLYNAPCHKARNISNWFLEHDNECTVLKWPPTVTKPQPNRASLGRGGMGASCLGCASHITNLHQLQVAILSIWANISKECFQHLDESIPPRIKAVLKAKWGQT